MVKKFQIGLFLSDPAAEAPKWFRVKKSTEIDIEMNSETEDFDFISDESATTEVTSYKPSIEQDLTMYKGEDDYEFAFNKFYNLQTGQDAHADCMIVFMHEFANGADNSAGYKAWQTDSVIEISDLNGVESKLNFNVLFGGTINRGAATMESGVPTFVKAV